MGVEIQGMAQLLRQLEQMGQNVEQSKEKALDAGAELMRSKISENTNRSDARTAHAADNVVIEADGDQRIVGYHKDHFYMKFHELGSSKEKAKAPVGKTFEHEKGNAQEKMKNVIREELGL